MREAYARPGSLARLFQSGFSRRIQPDTAAGIAWPPLGRAELTNSRAATFWSPRRWHRFACHLEVRANRHGRFALPAEGPAWRGLERKVAADAACRLEFTLQPVSRTSGSRLQLRRIRPPAAPAPLRPRRDTAVRRPIRCSAESLFPGWPEHPGSTGAG